jgi:hypothetical protein
MVSLARDLGARALAVSVSASSGGTNGRTTAALRRLRDALPRRCTLLVGGDGSPAARAGLIVFRDLTGLDAWARDVATA